MWPSSSPRWLSWLSSGPYARASSGVLTGASIVASMTRQDRGSLQHHPAPGSGPGPVARALAAVVQETMQPAHVTLWLHKDEQAGKPNTDK